MELLKTKIEKYLLSHFETNIENSTSEQLYYTLSDISNEILRENKANLLSSQNFSTKQLHYLSIEFLIGKNLKSNLWNLKIENLIKKVLRNYNKNIEDVYGVEKDAGLGNGGLGRLAACYLESLAKQGYNAIGHSIKYEFGLFKQKIIDNKQIELPDEWLDTGNVWLYERNDLKFEVEIGGQVLEHYSEDRWLSFEIVNSKKIEAVPFDMIISAFNTKNTATLRLWEAQAKDKIDLHLFDMGEFSSALKEQTKVNTINKVLYPNDNTEKGKDLRLIQQYFFVSAVMQNVLFDYFKTNASLENLSNAVAIHINDTHPALCIPELMRLLIDKYGFGWEEAWDNLTKTVFYTNHTILVESLEILKLSTIERLMPRIAQILKEINRRFKIELCDFFKNDYYKIENLSIIQGNNVFMANLAIYASKFVNGVAKVHSQILKSKIFYDYAKLYPSKFVNVTNGINIRKWLSMSNPKLDKLIISLIGNKFYDNAEELKKLEIYEDDEAVLDKFEKTKFENKRQFCKFVKKEYNIVIDPNFRFDVQAKRIHEYKRQLLNILKIIYLICEIRANPTENYTKQVFIFAGKAASGYEMAKRIIELSNCLSKEVQNDPLVSKYLQVVFLENYNVSLAEMLMPATDVSEQISLAGREASGTGNMKAVINGALMICTTDGANIEICEKCNKDNMFEFGLKVDDVQKLSQNGYNAIDYVNKDKIRVVLDFLNSNINGEKFDDIARYLIGNSYRRDNYMCFADFESYIEAHYKMDSVYQNKKEWNKRCIHSISNMGYFSADRSIDEYSKQIWNLSKRK